MKTWLDCRNGQDKRDGSYVQPLQCTGIGEKGPNRPTETAFIAAARVCYAARPTARADAISAPAATHRHGAAALEVVERLRNRRMVSTEYLLQDRQLIAC